MKCISKPRVSWLWRAIDEDGVELDILLQPRKNKAAARRFFERLLKANASPQVIVIDKLSSYNSVVKTMMPRADHRKHKRLNNRIEVSHQPTRLFKRMKRKFKSPPNMQCFLSLQRQLRNLFSINRHLLTKQNYKNQRIHAFNSWNDVTQAHDNYA